MSVLKKLNNFKVFAAAMLVLASVANADGPAGALQQGAKTMTGSRAVELVRTFSSTSISLEAARNEYGALGARLHGVAATFKGASALNDTQWQQLADKAAALSPEAVAKMFEASGELKGAALTPASILARAETAPTTNTGAGKYSRTALKLPTARVGATEAEITLAEDGTAKVAGVELNSLIDEEAFRRAAAPTDTMAAKTALVKTADETTMYTADQSVTRVEGGAQRALGGLLKAAAYAKCSLECRKNAVASVWQFVRLNGVFVTGAKGVGFLAGLVAGKMNDVKAGIQEAELTSGYKRLLAGVQKLTDLPKPVWECVNGTALATAY